MLHTSPAFKSEEAIDPKSASLPVQWQSELEPPTAAQLKRAEKECSMASKPRRWVGTALT